jgi:site-specific recombinase XerD
MANNSCLDKAVSDYLLWLIDTGYAESTIYHYERMLIHFQNYIGSGAGSLDVILSNDTITAYEKECTLKACTVSVWGIARYLYRQGKITELPCKKLKDLPILYETYLSDSRTNGSVSAQRIAGCRKTLMLLSGWLTRQGCKLQQLRIEQVDRFLSEISKNYAPETMQRHRSSLRGFLNWLFQNSITRRNLALLVVGPPQYAMAKPPRFLRADEIRKLFMVIPVTQSEQRTLPMLHLAYYLGLRPVEISRISLDDIQFSKQEILLPTRKSCNPITVPLPMTTIKAIADYVINVRVESDSRKLFLGLRAPYEPVKSILVCSCITAWMRKAGTPGSAYWLRHTYAQNLLEAEASIFEIKEMLGHDRIQTTSRYLRIHITMMRKVLFNEAI